MLDASDPAVVLSGPVTVGEHADVAEVVVLDDAVLLAEDSDGTTAAEIVYRIGTAPVHGELELDGVPLSAGGEFTQADVNDRRLTYVHTADDSTDSDSFTFTVEDADALASSAATFSLHFDPAPVIAINEPITVDEAISNFNVIDAAHLQVTDDMATPDQIVFTITTKVSVGWLKLDNAILDVGSTFTQRDINDGLLTYTTLGFIDNTADAFTFTVTDGVSSVAGEFDIAITPRNDPPTQFASASIDGSPGVVSNIGLRWSVLDWENDPITYFITSLPAHGELRIGGGAVVLDQGYTRAEIDTLEFIPTATTETSDSFGIAVNDGQGEGNQVASNFSITFVAFDYSDFTELGGPEAVANHNPVGPRMGRKRDGESRPTTPFDDNVVEFDDDDGITFNANKLTIQTAGLVDGVTSQFVVDVQNNNGGVAVVKAWIDFSGDGDFDDAGEELNVAGGGVVSGDGTTTISVDPAGLHTTNGLRAMRVRIARQSDGIVDSTTAAASGEVEDYVVSVNDSIGTVVTFTDDAVTIDSVDMGDASDDLVVTEDGPFLVLTRLDGKAIIFSGNGYVLSANTSSIKILEQSSSGAYAFHLGGGDDSLATAERVTYPNGLFVDFGDGDDVLSRFGSYGMEPTQWVFNANGIHAFNLRQFTGAERIVGGDAHDVFNIASLSPESGFPHLDGGGGQTNTISVTADADFTLGDGQLLVSDGTDQAVVFFDNINRAELTGGAGGNRFDVSDWIGTAELDGAGAVGDTIVYSGDSDIKLAPYTLKAANLAVSFRDIFQAKLTGGAGNNIITLDRWAGVADIDGGGQTAGGADTLSYLSGVNTTLNAGTLTVDGHVNTFTGIERVSLTGGEANNTFTLGDWTGPLSIFAKGFLNDTFVVARDADVTFSANSILIGNQTVNLSRVEIARVAGGESANTFRVYAWAGQAEIDGGGGGDTLIYNRNTAIWMNDGVISGSPNKTTFDAIEHVRLIDGSGDNTLTLGSKFSAGLSSLTVNGGSGADTLIYNETPKDGVPDVFTVNGSTLTAQGFTAALSAMENITYNGNPDRNVVTFAEFFGNANVVARDGQDSITVVRASGSFTLTGTQIVLGTGSIGFSALEEIRLVGGNAANSFTIQSVGAPNPWLGKLAIDGGSGVDTVSVSTNALNVEISDTQLKQSGVATWNLSSVEVAKLQGGDADQTFDVTGWTSGSAYFDDPAHSTVPLSPSRFDAGAGSDTFIRKNTVEDSNEAVTLFPWSIATSAAGKRTKRDAIAGMERAYLIGNTGPDVIDARKASIPVVLIGLGGDDSLLGSLQRDILIGGYGRDSIRGDGNPFSAAGNDDILIAGATSYDFLQSVPASKAAIDAILTAWLSADSYSNRISTITSLAKPLTAAEVAGDQRNDHLSGDGGLDWFFTDLADDGPEDDTGDETITPSGE